MKRRLAIHIAVAGTLLLDSGGGPARAAEDVTAELVRFVVGHLQATETDCSPEIRRRHADRLVICATYGARWSSFKSDWEFVADRFDFPASISPQTAWTRTDGRYEREFSVEKNDVSVTFDESEGRLVFAYTLEGDVAPAEPGTRAATARKTIRVAGFGGVSTPTLLEGGRVEPVYPGLAAEQGIEGTAALEAVIRADGTVGELKLLSERPEGWEFGEAALAAVRHWLYEPARFEGAPVDATLTIHVPFKPEP